MTKPTINKSFNHDNELEHECYKRVVKPYMDKQKYTSMFINYIKADPNNAQSILQAQCDIDFIAWQTKGPLWTYSIKTRRKYYADVFAETKKWNGDKGWALYTKADVLCYVWLIDGFRKWKMALIELEPLRKLNLTKYREQAAPNKADDGSPLPDTYGRIVPLSDLRIINMIENTTL
jgi:hypothetical protein